MSISFTQVIISLLAGIIAIIFLTVKWKVHPFFALLIACFVTGLGVQLGFEEILVLIKNGFGEVMSKLFIIIVLGTAIGVLLERNGSTQVMANYILKLVGERRSSLALSVTGLIVGLPIFCDSGYIVLNGINKSLTRRTGIPAVTMSLSLATGLLSVHCLLPPHPGATAAATALQVDFGKLILYGLVISIPVMLAGHWWAVYAGKRTTTKLTAEAELYKEEENTTGPRTLPAFLPVIVPIALMALRSIVVLEKAPGGLFTSIVSIAGDPAVALAVGVLLAIFTGRKKNTLSHDLSVAVEKAGAILVIIGAGGAFGAVLTATNIGKHFEEILDLRAMGIWFPFLLTFIIRTAQGSSTVAIITASSIILPLLPVLGLDSANARILTVLAMGSGSLMIAHTNDAYFWVISKFSDIDIKTMLRTYTIATILMALVSMMLVYILSLFIL